jgi:APA family basic amino acid/polyamine antiporter
MAQEKMFLPLAARLYQRYHTPHYSIFMQSFWASLLLLTNSYGQLLQYVTFGDWIFFGLTALALIVLRKKMPDLDRPYKTWGYPLVPVLFFLISAAVVVNVFVSSPAKSSIGSAIILGGLPLYVFFRKREKKDED